MPAPRRVEGPNWTMEVTGKKLSDVANMLGGLMLGRPVADKTGTTDVFTFVLEFAHDESAPGDFPPGFPSPFTATDEPGGASIFTALDKLGLKLAPDKAQKGYVVVDHIERPSEN